MKTVFSGPTLSRLPIKLGLTYISAVQFGHICHVIFHPNMAGSVSEKNYFIH